MSIKILVEDTLRYIELYSYFSNELILGTIAVESEFGKYRRQKGFENRKGGAYGICQIEMKTHDYLIKEYLQTLVIAQPKKTKLKEKILFFYNKEKSKEDNLTNNDAYNIAVCRLKYYSCPFLEPLNYGNNIQELGYFWKKYYNTNLGKGTIKDFVTKYNKYVLDLQ